MKISFSIPAYNEEKILADCLQSVVDEIKRSGAPAEVVVINNASTDRTKEIAAGFPDVRVIDEPQKGLSHARAAGMQATSGELIANIDADTKLPPGWLTTVSEEFNRDPALVALSGPFVYYDLSFVERGLAKLFYAFGHLLHLFNQYVLRKGAMLQGGNFVIRRDAFLKVGGFDTSIVFYGEDTDVARRLAAVGKVKWTWRLPMYASGRRLKSEGVVVTGWRYMINHLAVLFLKRAATEKYDDIRS